MVEGYSVRWLRNNNMDDHSVLIMKYDGPFTWAEWLKNEVRIKALLDSIEAEFQLLDKKTGIHNTVGMIVDVTNIDFSLIKPLSILPQASNSYIYTHPRAGRIAVLGLGKNPKTFPSEMVKLMFDVFTKAFPQKTLKVQRARNIEEALRFLKYS